MVVSIRFCRDCNNVLYPKENRQERRLYYACKVCDYQEKAQEQLVHRQQVAHVANETTAIVADLASDPTLPRTNEIPCPRCGHNEVVYFQSQSIHPDTRLTLYYLCCNTSCSHRWTSESADEA
ncbi:Zgc:103515 [Ramicandelaber brevisporus]|nr:Zgc:103515 [Ramicandelaber brevisporus]